MSDATETFENLDGTIEGALDAMILTDEETESEEDVAEATIPETEEEETEEESEAEPDESDESDEDEDEESDEDLDESEDDETEEKADSEQEQTKFTVKVDGKNEVVTLDELKQSFSGQKYIQQGMQQTAEAKKEAESVYSALLQERQAIAQLYEQAMAGNVPVAPKEPSRELFDTDPIGYMDAKLKYDDQIASYNLEMQKMQSITQQQSEAQQAAQQAYVKHELETLRQVIPELADKKQAPIFRDRLLRTGADVYGYTAEEIAEVMDHRAIRVLNDAAKYQEIINGKKAAVEKAKPENRKRRTTKAGSKKKGANSVTRKKQNATLAKTGSIEDAIALMMS